MVLGGYPKIPMKVDEHGLMQDDVTSKARGSVATLAESPARCGKKDAVFFSRELIFSIPIPSMGLVYLPTSMVDFYGKCIGKYTIHGWYGIFHLLVLLTVLLLSNLQKSGCRNS